MRRFACSFLFLLVGALSAIEWTGASFLFDSNLSTAWYEQGSDDSWQYEEYGRLGLGADLLLERNLTFKFELRSGDFWKDEDVELYYADLSYEHAPWSVSCRQETFGWGAGAQLMQLDIRQPWYDANLLGECRMRDLTTEWYHNGWKLSARGGASNTESAAFAMQVKKEIGANEITTFCLMQGRDSEYGCKSLTMGGESTVCHGPAKLYGGGAWSRWNPETANGTFDRWTWLAEPQLHITKNIRTSALYYQQGSIPGRWNRRLMMTSLAWSQGRWHVQPYYALNDWNEYTRRGCHLLLGYNVVSNWRLELTGGWSGGAKVNDAWDLALQWRFRYEAQHIGSVDSAAPADRL